jgi:flagellar motor switch protein FliG
VAMPERTSLSGLKGPEKAAMFLLASGEEHASKVFVKLQMDEIKEITQAMARLGPVGGELVEALFRDFIERVGNADGVVGGYHTTERLIGQFLKPEQVSAIMEDLRGPAGRTVWDKLGNVEESVLASYLKNEYPQTIAVVLSKVRSDHAARVLAALPEEAAIETVQRMLRMELVQKEVLNEVEETLRAEFMSNLARSDRRDNHEIMAEIFNSLDRSTETRFLELLEERNKEAADRVRALMFTFEDLIKVDGLGIQTLLRSIDNSKLGLALKGASEKLRELFFTNMSERAAKILRDDMENMGPVRLRDVEEAQMLLVNAAKDLAAAGKIFIADGKDDEMLV